MRIAGIIGGVGPQTTAEFYLEVIQGCQRANQTHRPAMLIFSIPITYQIESDVLLKAEGVDDCLPYILEAAQMLEKGGADFLVMPCNTLHVHMEQLARAVSIPVLDLIKETTQFLVHQGVTQVGVLATRVTTQYDVYGSEFRRNGITPILPDESEAEMLGYIIHSILKNHQIERNRQALQEIIAGLRKKQVEALVLACTDLQILDPKYPGIKIFDTMKILAAATVREILREPSIDSDSRSA